MSTSFPAQVTLGLVQMRMTADPEHNLATAVERIRDAAARGAQVICLPELFRSPYFCQTEDHGCFQLAEPIPGPAPPGWARSRRSSAWCSSRRCSRSAPRGCTT
ncbi:MAG: hypothetical protein KBF47_05175, partial [Gemmatimonadales bacterium]|nr:hypothetical protein [Gemmatimonadales bacterium]